MKTLLRLGVIGSLAFLLGTGAFAQRRGGMHGGFRGGASVGGRGSFGVRGHGGYRGYRGGSAWTGFRGAYGHYRGVYAHRGFYGRYRPHRFGYIGVYGWPWYAGAYYSPWYGWGYGMGYGYGMYAGDYGGYYANPAVTVVNPYPSEPAPPVIINQNFSTLPPSAAPRSSTEPEYERPQPQSGQPLYLLAFKDRVIRAAIAYWVDESTLHYVDQDRRERAVPLSSLDRDFTLQLNRERRVPFHLPPQ